MDWRGTITKWLQSDGTTVLASREYDAFGNIIPGSAVGTWPSRFSYQGQAWMEIGSADGAQRLIVTPTRVYEPTLAIFIQKDSLGKFWLRGNATSAEGDDSSFLRYPSQNNGAFITSDRSGYSTESSAFSYSAAQPLNQVDPTGYLSYKPQDGPPKPQEHGDGDDSMCPGLALVQAPVIVGAVAVGVAVWVEFWVGVGRALRRITDAPPLLRGRRGYPRHLIRGARLASHL